MNNYRYTFLSQIVAFIFTIKQHHSLHYFCFYQSNSYTAFSKQVHRLLFFFFLFISADISAQNITNKQWTFQHPFEQKLFIENKGQCQPNHPGLNKEDILFCARFGDVRYYFTKNSIWLGHFVRVKRGRKERAEIEKKIKLKKKGEEEESEAEEMREKDVMKWKGQEQFYCMQFIDNSPDAYIEGQQQQVQKYNFRSTNGTIQAATYHKILYHNLYSGIDMEIIFPEDKEGFKYTFIIHANADPAQIRIQYPLSGSLEVNKGGDLLSTSSFGTFTEHPPQTLQENQVIGCSFELKNGYNTFQLANYDHSQAMVIDPWVVIPNFTATDKAYDIDWDYAGNCYIYGGGKRNSSPHEISKMNSNGIVLWNYVLDDFGDGPYNYGDFAVDRETQSVYAVSTAMFYGDQIVKLDANGVKMTTFYRDSLLEEMWRISYNSCTHQAVIGGGGTDDESNHVIYLDTNLVKMHSVNILNSTIGSHDVWGVAQDNAGSCYIAFASIYGNFLNLLLKLPIPQLNPPTWTIPTHYRFNESLSNMTISNTVGYNGICMSNNALYTYDSYTLKKWNTATGVMLDSIWVNTDTNQAFMFMYYGGLTADDCDHVLLAVNNLVKLKDPNSHNLNTVYTAPDLIYDLSLGQDNILYVCGKGFVAAVPLNIPPCNPITTTHQHVDANCNKPGSASISASGGVAPYTISWNTVPVQTGNTIINLSPGTYVATITDASCPRKTKTDTIVITGTDDLLLTVTSSSVPCNNGTGSAKVSVSKGTPPYSYSWGPITGTDSILANVPAGTYTVIVTDKNGCTKTASVTISSTGASPAVSIAITNEDCNGGANGVLTAAVSGGIPPYTYLWSPGGATTSAINNLKAGIYKLAITAANGCKVKDSAQLLQPSAIQAITSTTAELCGNRAGSAQITATGGVPPYSYLWSNGSKDSSIINLHEGNYTVLVSDKNGCNKTFSVVVKNISDYGPKATFACKPSITDIFNPTVQFIDKSIGAKNWSWNFGDGKTDSIQHPTHTYKESGIFIVSLEIINTLGCRSIVRDTVTIRPFWSFYIPNSFTPDGDGVNDTFNGKGEGIQDYSMTIFNRWGEQIFTTNSLSVSWEGKTNKGNELAQMDTYLYLVILKDSKGKEHRYTGIVSLVK